MNDPYDPIYKGYLIFPRGLILLFANHDISARDFTFLLLIATQAFWDIRQEKYGVVKLDVLQLAELLNVNEGTIYNVINKFIKLGIMNRTDKNNLLINLMPFLTKDNRHILAKMDKDVSEKLFVLPQHSIKELQEKIVKSQFKDIDYTVKTVKNEFKSEFPSKEDLCSLENNENINPDDVPF